MNKQLRIGLRTGLILIFPFLITGCFNIIHYINVGKDGKVQVRWRMSVSSAFAEMGNMQNAGEEQKPSLGENLAEAKKNISESLKGVADSVDVQKFENDQSQGIDVSLTVKDLATLNAANLPKDEMPIVPIYDAKKKELIFRFTRESTEQLKGGDGGAESSETGEAEGGESEGEGAESMESGEGDPMGGMEQLGEKLGKLFSSAATYDIFIGSGFAVKEAFARDSGGTRRGKIEVIQMGDASLVRFPLLGMISEDKSPDGFEIVVQLK